MSLHVFSLDCGKKKTVTYLSLYCPSIKHNIDVINTASCLPKIPFPIFFSAKIFTFLDCLSGSRTM